MKLLVVMELEINEGIQQQEIHNKITNALKGDNLLIEKLDSTIPIFGNEYDVLTDNGIFEIPDL